MTTNKATKHSTRHERQHKQKDVLTKEPSLHASRRKRDTKCNQPEVKNVVSNGNKHFKETNEKKEKKLTLQWNVRQGALTSAKRRE
jgi:hypothetical protein